MQKKFKYTKKMREKQNNWQRIEAVIKWANMSTNYFARYIGLARGENLYQIKRGNNGISLDVADRIVNKFPQVDKLWLLTGEGQMFSETKLRGAQIPFYNADVEQSVTRVEQLEAECNLVVPPRRVRLRHALFGPGDGRGGAFGYGRAAQGRRHG